MVVCARLLIMKFYSLDFENMATMPKRFTADGENISPTFVIEDVPEDVTTLALLCYDPDATRGTPWVHWLVWGLNPRTKSISVDSLPNGSTEGVTSFGTKGYGGPSPSPGSGPHRYVFTLYALSKIPDLDGLFEYEEIKNELLKHSTTFSNWVGVYERK